MKKERKETLGLIIGLLGVAVIFLVGGGSLVWAVIDVIQVFFQEAAITLKDFGWPLLKVCIAFCALIIGFIIALFGKAKMEA